jgi:hypothetical protein
MVWQAYYQPHQWPKETEIAGSWRLDYKGGIQTLPACATRGWTLPCWKIIFLAIKMISYKLILTYHFNRQEYYSADHYTTSYGRIVTAD